jgi:hypothetical protein
VSVDSCVVVEAHCSLENRDIGFAGEFESVNREAYWALDAGMSPCCLPVVVVSWKVSRDSSDIRGCWRESHCAWRHFAFVVGAVDFETGKDRRR